MSSGRLENEAAVVTQITRQDPDVDLPSLSDKAAYSKLDENTQLMVGTLFIIVT